MLFMRCWVKGEEAWEKVEGNSVTEQILRSLLSMAEENQTQVCQRD